MDVDRLLKNAKQAVIDYANPRMDVSDQYKLTQDKVYIVWFSKTLQNWKALVSTVNPDGIYYEVTYNGDKKETYLDVYKKWDNVCIQDKN